MGLRRAEERRDKPLPEPSLKDLSEKEGGEPWEGGLVSSRKADRTLVLFFSGGNARIRELILLPKGEGELRLPNHPSFPTTKR